MAIISSINEITNSKDTTNCFFSIHLLNIPIHRWMMKKLNRLKVVLIEIGKTGKWLSEQLGKEP